MDPHRRLLQLGGSSVPSSGRGVRNTTAQHAAEADDKQYPDQERLND
jgi:hypothetical protein